VIPIAGFFTVLQGIAEVLRCVMRSRPASGLNGSKMSRRPHSCGERADSRYYYAQHHGVDHFLGFPTAFTLMALGVLFGFPSLRWQVFDLLVQRTFAVMANDVLISIPLFIFMGYVMERAGIMDRMFHSYRLLGHSRGL
jgi:hypothetical protein